MVEYDKQRKVDFVSGLTGSSVSDINRVSLALPLAIFLWSVLQSRLRVFSPYTPVALLVDVLLNCGVVLFAITIYASSSWLFNLLLALPAIVVLITSPSSSHRQHVSKPPSSRNSKDAPSDPLPVKPFVTHYRASMMVITCVAILAVDFRVFPRRFAKVENWGTSLMDMGVGSFVYTAGVVSVRSLLKTRSGQRPPLSARMVQSIRHSIPLLILGIIRLLSVKGLDYAEHVTEYGVHWNFFFTLGFLPPFVALFQSAFDYVPSYAVLSCAVAIIYQTTLDSTNLKAYILTAPRTGLLSQNREGVFSFVGYLAIFLAGQSLGTLTLPRQEPLPKDTPVTEVIRKSTLGRLVISACCWSFLSYIAISYHGLGLSVSRRLANLPYVLWVASYNSAQIAACCAIERFCFPKLYSARTHEEEIERSREATSPVLAAFNRNGLAVFLVANLLTGLVNLTIPTLDTTALQSMGVLVGYISIVSAVALGLDKLDLSIKL
ncbi:GPI-anchored wall transfer protein 1 [Lophiostoma macrostomum CBS 122681]|uniref:GPI-anchored wall transfer protein n=1 Tax=Lophiostoma macrostomum CBS 122681 TaxID=1314788 RepID=A0A6A6TR37_9PLEO|nr:GPI-anchored wall transfer protein 1 [Lophiostoma macrostomum CBS 122681]